MIYNLLYAAASEKPEAAASQFVTRSVDVSLEKHKYTYLEY